MLGGVIPPLAGLFVKVNSGALRVRADADARVPETLRGGIGVFLSEVDPKLLFVHPHARVDKAESRLRDGSGPLESAGGRGGLLVGSRRRWLPGWRGLAGGRGSGVTNPLLLVGLKADIQERNHDREHQEDAHSAPKPGPESPVREAAAGRRRRGQRGGSSGRRLVATSAGIRVDGEWVGATGRGGCGGGWAGSGRLCPKESDSGSAACLHVALLLWASVGAEPLGLQSVPVI